MIKYSIIVPIYNAEKTLDTLLKSITELEVDKNELEVLLVDNNSRDSTKDIILKWMKNYDFFKYIYAKDGQSAGYSRNVGIEKSSGQFILFTDSDCVLDKKWVINICTPFYVDSDIGLVGGEIETYDHPNMTFTEKFCKNVGFLHVSGRCNINEGYYPSIKKFYPSEVNGSLKCPFFASANFAIVRECISKGIRFWIDNTGEDVDFCLKLQKLGYKLYFQPSAMLYHQMPTTTKSFFHRMYTYSLYNGKKLLSHSNNYFEMTFSFFSINKCFVLKSKRPCSVIFDDYKLSLLLFIITIILFILKLKFLFFISLILTLLFQFFFIKPLLQIKQKKYFFVNLYIHFFAFFYSLIGNVISSIHYKILTL